MVVKSLVHSSLFALALGHDFCTMANHDGACPDCGTCPWENSNFGCKEYGVMHHADTNSVKKCLSQDASCGGSQERCYGTTYECEPGYVRPDGSSEYSVSCQHGAFDYGPACIELVICDAVDTMTAEVLGGPTQLEENASAAYECKAGWIDIVGPPPMTSFSVTCFRSASTPDSTVGELSPDPASKCAIKPGCTQATRANFDAEATMDDGSCVECVEDSHCPTQSKPVCNTAVGVCVQCTTQRHCSADTSQSCDMVSNTCQCATGYTGTPGPNGVCAPTNRCSIYDTEEVCLSYDGCNWEDGKCVEGGPTANKEDAGFDPSSLAIVAALIGLLLCLLLLCWLCCCPKRAASTGEEREHQLHSSSHSSSHSSGPYKGHRIDSRRVPGPGQYRGRD